MAYYYYAVPLKNLTWCPVQFPAPFLILEATLRCPVVPASLPPARTREPLEQPSRVGFTPALQAFLCHRSWSLPGTFDLRVRLTKHVGGQPCKIEARVQTRSMTAPSTRYRQGGPCLRGILFVRWLQYEQRLVDGNQCKTPATLVLRNRTSYPSQNSRGPGHRGLYTEQALCHDRSDETGQTVTTEQRRLPVQLLSRLTVTLIRLLWLPRSAPVRAADSCTFYLFCPGSFHPWCRAGLDLSTKQ